MSVLAILGFLAITAYFVRHRIQSVKKVQKAKTMAVELKKLLLSGSVYKFDSYSSCDPFYGGSVYWLVLEGPDWACTRKDDKITYIKGEVPASVLKIGQDYSIREAELAAQSLGSFLYDDTRWSVDYNRRNYHQARVYITPARKRVSLAAA